MKTLGLRLFARLGVVLWYGLTQLFTRKRGVTIPAWNSTDGIVEQLNKTVWKADPWKGKLDIMRHPTYIQQRFNEGAAIGDCDEHAAYWLYCLLHNGLADKAWLGCVYYKKGGHAVAIWEKDGQRYWADYDYPVPCAGWDWTQAAAANVGGIDPCFAIMCPVKSIRSGRVHFGHGDCVKL